MITTIKFPNHAAKAAKKNPNKNPSAIYFDCKITYTRPTQCKVFIIELISLQKNTRKFHLNWLAYLLEAHLNCICFLPKLNGLFVVVSMCSFC